MMKISSGYGNLMDLEAAESRGNMPMRASDCINVRDSEDTVKGDSLHKPPKVEQSVDMGMASEDCFDSIIGYHGNGSTAVHRLKKQVVLRKPYLRNTPNLIKSMPMMSTTENTDQSSRQNSPDSSLMP